MPFAKPTLASGDGIFDRCGPMVYTYKIESSRTKPNDGAFKVTMTSGTEYTSGNVDVRTDEQDFAIDASESKYNEAV